MQDESLIDEMRAALKGDRERAQRRGTGSPDGRPPAAAASPAPERVARPGFLARIGLRRTRS